MKLFASPRSKISVAIVYREQQTCDFLKTLVARKKILHPVGSFPSYQSFLSYLQEHPTELPQIILTEDKDARPLSERLPANANLVTVSNERAFFPDDRDQAIHLHTLLSHAEYMVNRGNHVGHINLNGFQSMDKMNEECPGKFNTLVDTLRDRGRICRKLRVGIDGMGLLGAEIVSALWDAPWIEKISCRSAYTDSLQAGALGMVIPEDSKIERVGTMEDLLSFQPDVVVIARGLKRTREQGFFQRDRALIQEQLFRESYPLVVESFQGLRKADFKGIVCVLSNIVERHLTIGYEDFGFDKHQLTSWSSDKKRAKICLINMLVARNPDLRGLQEHEVVLDVLGYHGGGEIPLLDSCMVRNTPLRAIDSSFVTEQRGTLQKRIVNLSNDLMQTAQRTGVNPHNVANAVKIGLHEHAYFACVSALARYAYMDSAALTQIGSLSGQKLSEHPAIYSLFPTMITSKGITRCSHFPFKYLGRDVATDLTHLFLSERNKAQIALHELGVTNTKLYIR